MRPVKDVEVLGPNYGSGNVGCGSASRRVRARLRPSTWQAATVNGLGDRCVVVVTHKADIDLAHHKAGAQLVALMGTGRAVFATLPVVND